MEIKINKCWILLAALIINLVGCRKDDLIIPEEIEKLPSQTVTSVEGFYLLNQGNMNTNKASLDYFDYLTGFYHRNVHGQANPYATLGLGDVGNDLGIYGSKLYAVINCSNKIEVMDVKTTKRLKVIDVKNGRHITFANGKAFVSAYDGQVQLGEVSPNGFVAEIDTSSLVITRAVQVGRQPEELAVVGNKLYVANSGGYSPPYYERTVSVIDLNTFEKIKDIDVAPNLQRLKSDIYNHLYVSSLGDHINESSNLFVIDTQTDVVKKSFNIVCSNLTIVGDTAYIIGSDLNASTSTFHAANYSMIHVKTQTLLEGSFLPLEVSNRIKKPYGIAVDPASRYIYITDATDYVSPGKLYCIGREGNIVFSVTTGDIPAQITFVQKEMF